MTSRTSLAEALLRLARRRWPAEIRQQQWAEWHAELAAIRDGSGIVRWYRQVRFAASLAAARPVEPAPDEHRVTWRETRLGAPELLGRLTLLLVVPLAGYAVVAPLAHMATNLIGALRPSASDSITAAQVIVNAVVVVAVAMAAMIAARSLARRAMRRQTSEHGRAVEARLAQIVLGAGVVFTAVLGDSRARLLIVDNWPQILLVGAGVAVATVLSLVQVALLVRRGSRGRAIVIGVVGWPLTVELAVAAMALPIVLSDRASPAVAFAWLPVTLFAGTTAGPPIQLGGVYLSGDLLSSLPLLLVMSTAFGLTYAIRLVRIPALSTEAAAPQATANELADTAARAGGAPDDPAVGARPPGAAVVVPAVAAMVGTLVWVAALTIVTPWQQRQRLEADRNATWSEELDQYYAWLLDLRVAAIALIALAVTALVAPHRPAIRHGLATFGVLLVIDREIYAGVSGVFTFALNGVLVVAVVLLLWVVPRRPALRPTALQQRRSMAGVAIVAAYLAPTLHVRGGWSPPAVQTMPPGLVALTSAIVVTLAGLAVASALSARPVRPGNRAVIGTALAAATGLGIVTALADLAELESFVVVLAAPPLSIAMAAVVRSPRSIRSSVLWLTAGFGSGLWLAAGLVSALAAVPLLILELALPAFTLGALVNPPTGDGFTVVIGGVAIALALAALLARVAVPRPTSQPHRGDQTMANRPTATSPGT